MVLLISGNTTYDGIYTGQEIQLAADFLRFEHTDGLNYLNVEVKRFDNIDHWFGLDLENLQINLTEGFGSWSFIPKNRYFIIRKRKT